MPTVLVCQIWLVCGYQVFRCVCFYLFQFQTLIFFLFSLMFHVFQLILVSDRTCYKQNLFPNVCHKLIESIVSFVGPSLKSFNISTWNVCTMSEGGSYNETYTYTFLVSVLSSQILKYKVRYRITIFFYIIVPSWESNRQILSRADRFNRYVIRPNKFYFAHFEVMAI